MFFERKLSKVIKNATKTFPVVLITGPRQVGKTTVFSHYQEPERTYITLDDPQMRAMAQNDPALFLQTYKTPLFIDEIQYAPQLFPYIKMAVDKEKKKGMFWLTGSQQFLLMRNVSESLAGRVAILELQGFSQSEKFQRDTSPFLPDTIVSDKREIVDVHQIYEMILTGSYPEIFVSQNINRKIFYASYLKTYVERDVRILTQITDEHSFVQFIKVAAARTGQLINYTDMASDVGVSVNTIKSWISLLETSGLIFLLQPYHSNITSRAVKTPKLYFLDTGLCCYLSGWHTVETLSIGAMSGAMLETYVVSEILKSYWYSGEYPSIYFYRDKEKKEIDLLIEQDGKLYPIEIKRTASPKENDVKSFNTLKSKGLPIGKGAIICFYEHLMPLNREVDIVPMSYLG
ncbi:MAG: ATP-binding protein [Lentimicrobiaceae bacterium]|jgi:predicted AAA+ superfamily ATPase|nr:ATP-binding protein [Lentimicrobiaceae bacterium]